MREFFAAAAGLVAGYLAWLSAAIAVAATMPVHMWVISTAVLLTVLAGAAFVLGRRSSTRAARQFFWWSPLTPVLASIYVLVVIAN